MLYTTTRDNKDAYTAHRTLVENSAPDGGAFVPFRMPKLTTDEIAELCTKNFAQAIAEILNRFFACKLTGWDVEFCIGRNSIRLSTMPHRIVIAELWHNPDGIYEHICNSLYHKLCNMNSGEPSEWFVIASHIAVLFGIYSEICGAGIVSQGDMIDLTVMADNLTVPIAAVYARQMGLPLGMIILTSENSNNLWDVIHLGEISAPCNQELLTSYERLIYALLNLSSAETFRNAMLAKRIYRIEEEQLPLFNKGLFCAVTGNNRSAQNINSIFRSNSYILDPATALSIGGLQDYRAKSGDSRLTLALSYMSPMNCIREISEATGMSQEKLTSILSKPLDGR